ncbi:MAG: hypothetical protein K8E66_05710, partial [Phycisphaerales bacterium]|nr:hypothetical protein [Phycisphaerales bacterium]
GMVWVVGLNRTGTTSLAHALCRLGYPNLHYPNASFMIRGDRSIFREWRGGSDIPVAAFYQKLDEDYPASKFILSTRDQGSWLRSVISHFERVPRDLDQTDSGLIRKKVYGHVRPTPEQFSAAWDRHHAAVRAYFRVRPNDLIEMDITRGDGWARLCPFLGVPVPADPYPNANRSDGNDSGGCPEAISRHNRMNAQLRQLAKQQRHSLMGQLNRP